MTEPTRQLPGVKGQFILCSDCQPTKADGNRFGIDIYVCIGNGEYKTIEEIGPCEYWRPVLKRDPRPFTLPALPAPEQAAEGKRNIDDLMVGTDGVVVAFADDKTAWFIYEQNGGKDYPRNLQWHQLPPLPDREV
jgi:hypothetical protein